MDKLSYEDKVNYKFKIFEILFPMKLDNLYADSIIDKVLKDTNRIYEELIKI